MNKITETNNIIIGNEYLYEELESFDTFYFKSYPVKVKIESFDGKDFWVKTRQEDDLFEDWNGYESLCIGSPDDNTVAFYELTEQ